jgi:hypothetical protein
MDKNPLNVLDPSIPKLSDVGLDPAAIWQAFVNFVRDTIGIDLSGPTEFLNWIGEQIGVGIIAFVDGVRMLVDGLISALANPLGFLEVLGGAIQDALESLGAAFAIGDGSPVDDTGVGTTLTAYEATANKGVANGYAPLDASALIDSDYLPGTLNLIKSGTGAPEGNITATVGSLFLRTDGGAGTTLYVKESGSGDTGWIAK